MEPRWGIRDATYEDNELKFLGYANDLDVWLILPRHILLVVGPEEKRKEPSSDFNFDSFDIGDGVLVIRGEYIDLHIDLHDMCLIYALCTEHGLFKENENV